MDAALWQFVCTLVIGDQRRHDPPRTISDWEPFLKLSIAAYSVYFDLFYPPGEQLVGGGVDVESIAWPD